MIRSINGCDVANRINGVPRPTYWGYCCRYQLHKDADAVVCAGVKSCAGTASSPIVKRNLPQMWKQGSSLHMCACVYLKWQSSVSHGGSMIESISRWSIDHATASSQNPHYSACRITYFLCNIQIGGYRSWSVVVVGHLVRTDWNCWWLYCFIVEIPMWPPLSAAQPRLQDQLRDLGDPIRESPK